MQGNNKKKKKRWTEYETIFFLILQHFYGKEEGEGGLKLPKKSIILDFPIIYYTSFDNAYVLDFCRIGTLSRLLIIERLKFYTVVDAFFLINFTVLQLSLIHI